MPAADTDVATGRPGLSEAVHRQHRCCYLPWTRYCPTDVIPGRPGPYRGRSPAAPLLVPAADTDVAQAVPAPTVVVQRQRRCLCPPRTPMSPRPSRPLRGRSPTAPLLPAADPPSQLPPWSFTDSTAADPLLPRRCQSGRPGRHRRCSPAAPLLLPAAVPPLPHRCRAGRPGRHRGCSPTAPLLLPAADPLLPPIEVVHRHHRCCCPPPLPLTRCAPPMPTRPSRLMAPPMITDAAAAAVCCAPAAAPPMSPEKPPATCADAR